MNYQDDPTYKEQSNLIDQESNLGQQGFNQQRQQTLTSSATAREDTIRSYQDALDEIRRQRQSVGINFRTGAAQRNLYDASGDVSGIGQNVGAQMIAPLEARTAQLTERHGRNLADLQTRESQALGDINTRQAQFGIDTQRQRLSLRDQIIGSLQKASESQHKERRDQESKGREYLSTPQAVTRARKAGRTVIKVGRDQFALGPIEEIQQQTRIKNYNKKSTTRAPGDKPDPFKVERNTIGGLSFFEKGKPVTAAVYAQKNNKSIAEVLRESQDPGDKEYLQDVQELTSRLGTLLPDGRTFTKAILTQTLKESYPHIYGTSR